MRCPGPYARAVDRDAIHLTRWKSIRRGVIDPLCVEGWLRLHRFGAGAAVHGRTAIAASGNVTLSRAIRSTLVILFAFIASLIVSSGTRSNR